MQIIAGIAMTTFREGIGGLGPGPLTRRFPVPSRGILRLPLRLPVRENPKDKY